MDRVAGRTALRREVLVTATPPQADRCSQWERERVAVAGGDGSFAIDWNDLVDFDHSASSTVCARDANGNGACLATPAFHVAVFARVSQPVLDLVPSGAGYTVSLTRGEDTGALSSGVASSTGSCNVDLWSGLQPADVYQVTSEGHTLMYRHGPIAASLDYVTDRATGSAQPGAALRARFQARSLNAARWSGLYWPSPQRPCWRSSHRSISA